VRIELTYGALQEPFWVLLGFITMCMSRSQSQPVQVGSLQIGPSVAAWWHRGREQTRQPRHGPPKASEERSAAEYRSVALTRR